MKYPSYHDVFGRLVLAPATSYSNDDEDLVDHDGYIESLRNIPPPTLQNPRIPPNYLVMPSHPPPSPPPSLQNPRIPPNYLVMPSHPPTSPPSPK